MADSRLDLVSQLVSELSELLKRAQHVDSKFYIVVAKNVGEPLVITCDTIDQCIEKLKELKSDQPSPTYVYIFEGHRWFLTKYPTKGLKRGEMFVPLLLADGNSSENGETVNLSEL